MTLFIMNDFAETGSYFGKKINFRVKRNDLGPLVLNVLGSLFILLTTNLVF